MSPWQPHPAHHAPAPGVGGKRSNVGQAWDRSSEVLTVHHCDFYKCALGMKTGHSTFCPLSICSGWAAFGEPSEAAAPRAFWPVQLRDWATLAGFPPAPRVCLLPTKPQAPSHEALTLRCPRPLRETLPLPTHPHPRHQQKSNWQGLVTQPPWLWQQTRRLLAWAQLALGHLLGRPWLQPRPSAERLARASCFSRLPPFCA